jgi:hypothetical protein
MGTRRNVALPLDGGVPGSPKQIRYAVNGPAPFGMGPAVLITVIMTNR